MFRRKCQRMGSIAVLIASVCIINPVIARASDVEEVVVLDSYFDALDEETESKTNNDSSGDDKSVDYIEKSEQESDVIRDNDEIWAQIDKDELRVSVDVEALKESIDDEELLKNIDVEALEEQIDMDAIKAFVDGDTHPVDVMNVQLPVVKKKSPFNFVIDPDCLIYKIMDKEDGTNDVEKDANVLFINTKGDYTFSSKSDEQVVINKSNIPIKLTIDYRVDKTGTVTFVEKKEELVNSGHGLFLAIADKDGIKGVFNSEENRIVEVIIDAVPDDTYTYEWNEEAQRYDYSLADGVEEVDFPTYSFYMTGMCNAEGNWSGSNEGPAVSLSWSAAPATAEDIIKYESEKAKAAKEKDEVEAAEQNDDVDEAAGESSAEDEIEVVADEAFEKFSNFDSEASEDEALENVIIEDEAIEKNVAENKAEDEIIEEATPTESDENVTTESQSMTRDEKIEFFKKKELDRLIEKELELLRKAELERLIDKEVERLANEKYDEILASMKADGNVENSSASNNSEEETSSEQSKEDAREENEDAESESDASIGASSDGDTDIDSEASTGEDDDIGTETGSNGGTDNNGADLTQISEKIIDEIPSNNDTIDTEG
jgi:hypothetical protein